MRAVVQRVSRASVTVEGQVTGQINRGFLVLMGVEAEDSESDIDYLLRKILGLRVFEDADGKMNLDIQEVGGALLVVSQFTLLGDCRKGRRPSFITAAGPDKGRSFYEQFVTQARQTGIDVETGQFQAHMDVELVNDGPVTILLDSHKLF
ncbi:D-tyrosyl-tRNA(Tyr) deacylase [Polystyrenella longa]|uniref:D-aminoacyl-tRNA deacylase n=1 Tax=Polystyrenella longa TaxID=2528007 RepID=A0A518CKJ4_9PLAN|nr:D-aminoacyl-tRNA deacylase [Polystyrenella longa]QDU79741.1 D-tyrosyl-tRNA(Tyr) deacylase [Polystyrenella longa]